MIIHDEQGWRYTSAPSWTFQQSESRIGPLVDAGECPPEQ
jgi:hypothetical protein